MIRVVIGLVLCVLYIPVRANGYCRYATYDSLITAQITVYDLPETFRYIPLLLTDCRPEFVNEYASGAWALPAAVAHHYDVLLRPDYDGRFDMVAATQAAAAYLADLYYYYDCDAERTLWHYIECVPQLSSSTAREGEIGSLLERLGQNYKMADMPSISDSLSALYMERTVRLGDFCRLTGVDSLTLLELNPAISPKARLLHEGSRIYLPSAGMGMYYAIADSLYACSVDTKADRVMLPTERPKPRPTYTVYRVRQGDTLGHIALRHHVGVSQLKRWNGLRSDMLQIGQRLKIYR